MLGIVLDALSWKSLSLKTIIILYSLNGFFMIRTNNVDNTHKLPGALFYKPTKAMFFA